MQKIAVIQISNESRELSQLISQELKAVSLQRASVGSSWTDFDAFIFIGALGI